MPRRVVFQNLATGRFVSAEEAGELERVRRIVTGDGGREEQILSFGSILEDLTQGAESNWQEQESKWGMRWYADEDTLNLSALQDAAFPSDADAFRITYQVPNNPDYPRPYASSEWFTSDQWPPDLSMLEGHGPTGIAQIVFRNN